MMVLGHEYTHVYDIEQAGGLIERGGIAHSVSKVNARKWELNNAIAVGPV